MAADLRDHGLFFKEVTIDKLGSLTDLESGQVFATVEHLGLLTETGEFEDAFNTTDEGSFEIVTFKYEGVRGQWVDFYAGDTQVGVVFARRHDAADRGGERRKYQGVRRSVAVCALLRSRSSPR